MTPHEVIPTKSAEAGGVTVTINGTDLGRRGRQRRPRLWSTPAYRRAWSTRTPTLWGDARRSARRHPSWLARPAERVRGSTSPNCVTCARSLLAAGIDHVVLAGMGGSSLAPEVIAATAGVRLTVLDTTDAGQVAAAIADHLENTVLVVSSKSGGTLETDSHRRVYEQAFRDAGIDPCRRIVVVTDPGSPLETSVAGGRLPSVPRRPECRRPLQRALGIRSGAERAWPASMSAGCSTTPPGCHRPSTATTTTPV